MKCEGLLKFNELRSRLDCDINYKNGALRWVFFCLANLDVLNRTTSAEKKNFSGESGGNLLKLGFLKNSFL